MTRRTSTILAWAAILGACAASIALNTAHAQGSGSLTIATAPAPLAGQVIPTLSWTTTPAGATCTASGDAAWNGTKAAQGSQALPARTLPTPLYAISCTWPDDTTATLTWVAPTTNTDNTPLAKCALATDTGPCLAKYRIYRSNVSAASVATCVATTVGCEVRDHNFPSGSTAIWNGLAPGTHYFSLTAVTGQGVESARSSAVSKAITAAMQWTASVGAKIPNAVTGLTVE